MALVIKGNPDGARLAYSASIARDVSRGRFWDEEIEEGLSFRFVDVTLRHPGWFRVTQSGINLSSVLVGSFDSSFYTHRDAAARDRSLRVFALKSQRVQTIAFRQPSHYRVTQLVLSPQWAQTLLGRFDIAPDEHLARLHGACHKGRQFAVRNHALPSDLGADLVALQDGSALSPRRRLRLKAKALDMLDRTLELIEQVEAIETGGDARLAAMHHCAALLDARYADPPSLAELAAELDMGIDTLQRSFKAVHGTSIRSWLTERRLHRAAELLMAEIGDIAGIGLRVGYTSPSAFSRAFTRQFGYPPTDLRAKSHPRAAAG